MIIIKDTKPSFSVMKNTSANSATFGNNSTTYNEAGYTYNEAGNTYGGADRISDIGPQVKATLLDIKPKIISIKNL